MKVAITGKGGVGKTTIAAVLARTLARAGEPVVALDADANPNLAISLGLGAHEAARLNSVANALLDDAMAFPTHSDHHAGGLRFKGAEELLTRLGTVAPDGVQLLQTGRIERPTEGCLCCGSHRSTRRIFDELDGRERFVVTDLEAGVSDLMWVWPKAGDVVLIVTEPYQKSLEVARRALQVATELGVERVLVIANRIEGSADADRVRRFLPGVSVTEVPEDDAARQAGAQGRCPLDLAPASPAVTAVAALAGFLRSAA